MLNVKKLLNWKVLMGVFAALVVAVGIFCTLYIKLQQGERKPDNPEPKKIPVKLTNERGATAVFPKSARCENHEVNLFLSRFLDIILSQDYKAYRRNVTELRQPLGEDTFEHAQYKAERLEIKGVRRLPEDKNPRPPMLRDVRRPIYRVDVHADMRDGTTRDISIYIFRENGRWVSSH